MRRYLVLGLSLYLLTASSLPITGAIADAHAAPVTLSSAINKAGRQRMLSQRLAKAWIMLGIGIAPDRARAILIDSLTQFENQLAELRGFTPNPDSRDALAHLEKEWINYKAVLSSKPSHENAIALYGANEAVQKAAHRLTLAYDVFADSRAHRLINIAGRQRMLSQRMAKFWLFDVWGIYSQAAKMDFGLARAEFASGLHQLSISPHNTADIRTALEQLDREWTAYRTGLTAQRNIPEKIRAAAEVMDMSERVLTECERIVTLYEQQAGAL